MPYPPPVPVINCTNSAGHAHYRHLPLALIESDWIKYLTTTRAFCALFHPTHFVLEHPFGEDVAYFTKPNAPANRRQTFHQHENAKGVLPDHILNLDDLHAALRDIRACGTQVCVYLGPWLYRGAFTPTPALVRSHLEWAYDASGPVVDILLIDALGDYADDQLVESIKLNGITPGCEPLASARVPHYRTLPSLTLETTLPYLNHLPLDTYTAPRIYVDNTCTYTIPMWWDRATQRLREGWLVGVEPWEFPKYKARWDDMVGRLERER